MVNKRNLNNIVLCYHGFALCREEASTFTSTVEDVKNQINFLRDAGYSFVAPSQYYQWYKGTYFPATPIACVTIDDAEDSVSLMVPWFIENAIPFGIAVIGRKLRKHVPEEGYLSWATLNSWVATGLCELMSHSYNLHNLGLVGEEAMADPIMEGPCWLDDGDVLYRETGDARYFWDNTFIDDIAWRFPLFGSDPGTQFATKVTSSVTFVARYTGTVRQLRVWAALNSPSGCGYEVKVKIFVNNVSKGVVSIAPKDYEVRQQWPEREFLTIELPNSFNTVAGTTYTIKFQTQNVGEGCFFSYVLPDFSGNYSLTTNCTGVDYEVLEDGTVEVTSPDYPANASWPAKACMIACSGEGEVVSEAAFAGYIAADCAAFSNAVQRWQNAEWTKHPNPYNEAGDLDALPLYGTNASGGKINRVLKYRANATFTAETIEFLHWDQSGEEYPAIVDVYVGTTSGGPWTKVTTFQPNWWVWHRQEIELTSPYTFTGGVTYWVRFQTRNTSPYGQGYCEIATEKGWPILDFWSAKSNPAPQPSFLVYPYGAYFSEETVAWDEVVHQSLRDVLAANGFIAGFTIWPGRQDQETAAREAPVRGSALTLSRFMVYGDFHPRTIFNHLRAYIGVMFDDMQHEGVAWQVSYEPDPLGNPIARRSRQALDYITFDAWFFRPGGKILRAVLNDGGTYFDGVADRTGDFVAGETLTGLSSGATSTIVWANNTDKIDVIEIEDSEGIFLPGQTVTGQSSGASAKVAAFSEGNGCIKYSELTGTFETGEEIWNNQDGELSAAATVVRAGPTAFDDIIKVVPVSGTYQAGEIVTGSVSHATAVVDQPPLQFADDKGFLRSRGVQCFLIIGNGNYSDPTVDDVDPAIASYVVNNPSEFIDQLVTIAVDDGWDGITGNLEAIPQSDRNTATEFFTQLANALHAAGKLLHITAPATTGTEYDWPSWVGWCDHGALARVVDGIKIMSYTESGPYSPPRPAAPDWFMDAVYSYCNRVIPQRFWPRILVGCNAFGHMWTNGVTGEAEYLSYHDALAEAFRMGAPVKYDDGEGHWKGLSNECWFGVPKTLKRAARIAVANNYGGIGLWQITDGDMYEFFPQYPVLGRLKMKNFIEERFPVDISYGAQGGPEFKTNVIKVDSGHENRLSLWDAPLSRYDVAHAVKTQEDIERLNAFFRVVKGKLIGFRFKDWADYRAINQLLGTGDGTQVNFQLRKAYAFGAEVCYRTIFKPVAGTVKVYVNGVEQDSGWTMDTTKGLVSFLAPPASGALVSADFEFDIPARFDTDYMPTSVDSFNSYSWNSISIIEVRI